MTHYEWGYVDDAGNDDATFHFNDNELHSVLCLFESFRTFPVTIVLGNLGRKDEWVHYYTNVSFSQSDVCTPSDWEKEKRYDWMVWSEPDFSETVAKPENVRHLVVFTSHLNLNFSHLCRVVSFVLGPSTPPIVSDEGNEIDLRSIRSPHKAFLELSKRLDRFRNRPVTVVASETTLRRLCVNLQKSIDNAMRHSCSHNVVVEYHRTLHSALCGSPCTTNERFRKQE
ncbi:hypothetical protein AVEN_58054-1 [Araneus ventricosus]|uniref:Uncharacterized protein n=1 Tax=Araneus ventricosus TaxID=182803 RepID=A0A4Y2WSL8_ARAVE|nr:hypothetical protein AVEN_58054-1 [Araneus ventricosus]